MNRTRALDRFSLDPKSARIADLSEEYLTADAMRQSEIGAEIADLIVGRLIQSADAK